MVTWLISGNRDEDVFETPTCSTSGATPTMHLTFGPGGVLHIGAGLARLEIRLMFEELVPRIGSIELTGPVERLRSNFFNAIKRMPVPGENVISLRRIDHVSLRDRRGRGRAPLVLQFGWSSARATRLGHGSPCDDEPFSLELLASQATPGVEHVAYELRRSCALDDAPAPAGRGV